MRKNTSGSALCRFHLSWSEISLYLWCGWFYICHINSWKLLIVEKYTNSWTNNDPLIRRINGGNNRTSKVFVRKLVNTTSLHFVGICQGFAPSLPNRSYATASSYLSVHCISERFPTSFQMHKRKIRWLIYNTKGGKFLKEISRTYLGIFLLLCGADVWNLKKFCPFIRHTLSKENAYGYMIQSFLKYHLKKCQTEDQMVTELNRERERERERERAMSAFHAIFFYNNIEIFQKWSLQFYLAATSWIPGDKIVKL